jgi:lysyl-tRNA synthetase class 2
MRTTMTASVAERLGLRRGVRKTGAVRAIAWAARLVGLLALASAIAPAAGRRRLRPSLSEWVGLPPEATVAAGVVALGAAVLLMMLAAGLSRRKRRAWQLAVLLTALIAVLHLVFRHGVGAVIASSALLAVLLANRREFHALPDPAIGRWRAIRVFVQLAASGVLINFVVLWVGRVKLQGDPSVGDRLLHSVLALVGVSGPVHFRAPLLDDLTAGVGLLFGIGSVLLGGYFLLRAAEPHPVLSTVDETRIRGLLDTHGRRDSLGYFALGRNRSVVFSPSGKAAVTYRVLAGVALAAGDPLGDHEAWPGAIAAFLDECWRYGWIPAVLGCSEQGATVWSRNRLRALELGDEAVVDTGAFTMCGRPMRGVRQMATRAARAGYRVRVRRAAELDPSEWDTLTGLAERWRGTETERGYSMALCRLADRDDLGCVLVTAEREGSVRAMLQLVPWGTDGLSLDLMRRDRDIPDTGLNELMITELLLAGETLGVQRVSLNFAVFRAALERGQRIGAGPVARLWARALRLASRWWQIESLYRFNAKFHPLWEPRFLVYPAARNLPRIALAALEAEGFGGRPPALLRLLRRI